MSYCVNCGVELAASQKRCPLCGVEVINPAAPHTPPEIMPYPKRVEYVMRRVDRRYGALLATIALSIPVVCTALIDIFLTKRLSWSGYVTGAAVCLFIWVILPILLKKRNPYLLILYDTIALQAYLADICLMTAGIGAYVKLAMPLAFAACALAYILTPILRSRRLAGSLYKSALIAFIAGAFCVVVEMIVDLYLHGVFQPAWSLIAAAPCMVVGGMLCLLERKQKLKDKIRRRLLV